MPRALPALLVLIVTVTWAAVVTVSPAGAPEESRPAPERDIRFVVIHHPGPKWVEGKSIFEQPGLEAHIEHYRKLLAEGKLMVGGPFLDDDGGGMMIPEPGTSREEIATFAEADPAVRSGLLTFEVRPWLVGMRR